MLEKMRFQNPPITEAIIDLRVQPRGDLLTDDLAFLPSSSDRYPVKETLFHHQQTVSLHGTGEAEIRSKGTPIGFKYIAKNDGYVMQSQQQGFTLSKLAPYDCWESFQKEARELWEKYRAVTRPIKISRLAVRYINKIDIPRGDVELDDYFETHPTLSPQLSLRLSGFFMQLRVPIEEINSMATINQTRVEPTSNDVISILFDIDVFRIDGFWDEEAAIWTFFEKLRWWKNELFRLSTTGKAKELFK